MESRALGAASPPKLCLVAFLYQEMMCKHRTPDDDNTNCIVCAWNKLQASGITQRSLALASLSCIDMTKIRSVISGCIYSLIYECRQDKCCDICGDAGSVSLLITCSRCKSSCEHLYCMRTYSEVHPESWYCEECQDFIKQSSLNIPGLLRCGSSHPIGLPNDPRLNSINRGKKIQTGKVKYISPREVIMLESGSPSSIRHKNRSMCNLQLVSGNPSLEHSERMRPPTAYQQVTESSGRLGGGAVSSNLEKEMADPMSIISLCALPMNDESVYTPASDASWRGSFIVLLRDPKEWEVSCGLQAHPPSRVRRKVYESSRQMPEVLECELVQRGSLWMSLFGSHCPGRRDIGLYFFPSNLERCKNYVSLLEHMGKQDLLLRKYLDDSGELLIFTSQILPMDCRRWNGKYFLWGVFRRTKLATTSIPEKECPDEGNNNEVADMEIATMG